MDKEQRYGYVIAFILLAGLWCLYGTGCSAKGADCSACSGVCIVCAECDCGAPGDKVIVRHGVKYRLSHETRTHYVYVLESPAGVSRAGYVSTGACGAGVCCGASGSCSRRR